MKPYHIDFPNVKNNCLRFEVSPSIEESATFTDAEWAELGNDFMQRMGLANHQYIIIRHSGTAVSYTHLDVYKRQAVRRARKSKPTCTYWQTGFPFPGNCTGTTG